jgi:multidrug efflux pump subunit AcrA (membrane-fusion protein)
MSDRIEPLSDFDFLASFAGEPGVFWPRWCVLARARFEADGACLLLQAGQGVDAVRVVAQDRPSSAQRVVQSGVVPSLGKFTAGGLHVWTPQVMVLSLPGTGAVSPQLWLVLLEAKCEDTDATARELRLLAETYQARRREGRQSEQLLTLREVLDLGLDMGGCKTMLEAGLRLCHRVAAILGGSRVTLGWREGVDLKLIATSHGGRVAQNLQEAEAIVRTMEECADQNNEVAFPAIAESRAVTREHQAFSRTHEDQALLSAPLRDGQGAAAGVLLVEREAVTGRWAEADLERLRLACDLVAGRLNDLHQRSVWWGRRAWRALRASAAKWLGVEQTGPKLAVLALLVTVICLAVIPVDHKVSAPFLLKTDSALLSTAPFSGYIDEVRYHLGDVVKKGTVLLTLDRRELLLEEANGMATRDSSEREARSYEAENKLAEALMAKARVRQEDAKLAIVRHRLAKTEVKAPFDGVVVEGDLRERLSAPVQLGEPLLKMVQLRDLTGLLQVDERDIGFLAQGLNGEVVFASRPGEAFKVLVDRFEPVAEVRAEGNVFLLRVQITDPSQDWWRPGMSGVCKIVAGRRSLLWVLTHRTVETLRLWLWW